MIDRLSPLFPYLEAFAQVEVAAPTVVVFAVAIRAYFGSVLFHPRYIYAWNLVRRLATPLIQRLVYRHVGQISIENESEPEEYAAVVEARPKPVAVGIDEVREVEIPLLAGFKTAPDGREEAGTFVWYLGPRPFSWLPRWLRRYQVHVTVFRREDGEYDLYAHYEANSYRPDLWADHLFKRESFSAEKGVTRTQNALDDAEIEWVSPSARGDSG
jgi:hypothetical protein